MRFVGYCLRTGSGEHVSVAIIGINYTAVIQGNILEPRISTESVLWVTWLSIVPYARPLVREMGSPLEGQLHLQRNQESMYAYRVTSSVIMVDRYKRLHVYKRCQAVPLLHWRLHDITVLRFIRSFIRLPRQELNYHQRNTERTADRVSLGTPVKIGIIKNSAIRTLAFSITTRLANASRAPIVLAVNAPHMRLPYCIRVFHQKCRGVGMVCPAGDE